jgi:hypothetical protein
MAMAKAHQGLLLEDGRLMFNGSLVKSRAPRLIAFNFLDDNEVEDTKTHRQKQLAAIRKAISNAAEAEGELTDADWDELATIRLRTNAGLARKIEL